MPHIDQYDPDNEPAYKILARFFIALLLPPLAVIWLRRGSVILAIILTLALYIPGIIYAAYLTFKYYLYDQKISFYNLPLPFHSALGGTIVPDPHNPIPQVVTLVVPTPTRSYQSNVWAMELTAANQGAIYNHHSPLTSYQLSRFVPFEEDTWKYGYYLRQQQQVSTDILDHTPIASAIST